MNMTKYGKHESDELWSIKWMRWAIVDEMNGIDFGLWTQQRWFRPLYFLHFGAVVKLK